MLCASPERCVYDFFTLGHCLDHARGQLRFKNLALLDSSKLALEDFPIWRKTRRVHAMRFIAPCA